MSGRPKVPAKDSTKSAFEPQRASGAFEPRAFAPPVEEAEPVSDLGRAELLDAYLQRKARLEAARQKGPGSEEVAPGRNAGMAPPVPPVQLRGAREAAENHTGMPDGLKAGLEGLSGRDLSGVRVHYNSAKPARVEALAYTQGQDIHVGPGQERYLAHEGWHVVQQMEGRVRPTLRAHGVGINDDVGLEREADVMGTKALQTRRSDQVATSSIARATTVEQRQLIGDTIQRHHNLPLDDATEARAHIYAVTENNTGNTVYIGQTCDQVGVATRFQQHLNRGNHPGWSNATHSSNAIWTSVMTQFETTVYEQYYIDGQGGIGNLENAINAMTQATFDRYSQGPGNPRDGNTWRPR